MPARQIAESLRLRWSTVVSVHRRLERRGVVCLSGARARLVAAHLRDSVGGASLVGIADSIVRDVNSRMFGDIP